MVHRIFPHYCIRHPFASQRLVLSSPNWQLGAAGKPVVRRKCKAQCRSYTSFLDNIDWPPLGCHVRGANLCLLAGVGDGIRGFGQPDKAHVAGDGHHSKDRTVRNYNRTSGYPRASRATSRSSAPLHTVNEHLSSALLVRFVPKQPNFWYRNTPYIMGQAIHAHLSTR